MIPSPLEIARRTVLPIAALRSFLEWIEKNQRIAAFVATLSLFFFLHIASGVTEFYWDSRGYWQLASMSQLLNFPKDAIRGYFYPAALSPARGVSDLVLGAGLAPYKVYSSFIYAYAFAILLPSFYVSIFGGNLSFPRRLAVPTLVAALCPGVITYTLSDLPAAMFMLGALYCIKRSAEGDSRLLLILAGFLAYGAYNTRTIYLFPMAVAAIAAPLVFRGHNARTKILATTLFLLGIALASVPQSLINLKNRHTFWPGVITDRYHQNLFASQLLWGITLQRYETSIDKTLPYPGLFYMDRAGERLFREEKIEGRSFGISTYMALALKHPVEFLGIYGRHVVSGLDLRDGDVYTRVLSKDKPLRSALNFLIVFSGLAVMATGISRAFDGRRFTRTQLLFGFAMLLPVALAIPGAIETRFFLPLHLAIYSTLAFNSDIAALRTITARRWFLIATAFAVSAVMFFAVTTETMANQQFEYPYR